MNTDRRRELILACFTTSPTPHRTAWPLLTERLFPGAPPADMSAAMVARVVAYRLREMDRSWQAGSLCGVLIDRRAISRAEYEAWESWSARWRRFQREYADWLSGYRPTREHGGQRRKSARKAQRQARRKARR
jgi:hypothetical protein